eukprot:jgi/Mesen1/6939/ME000036S06262
MGREDDSAVVKIWERMGGASVAEPEAAAGQQDPVQTSRAAAAALKHAAQPAKVAFIGLGAMGSGMAASLLKGGLSVTGFDVAEAAMQRLQQAGGAVASSPQDAAQGADVVVIMVTTAAQAESALFGPQGAASGLKSGAVVVLCSTVAPNFVRQLHARLSGVGVEVVDAPVSGGVARAAAASLTIMAAGSDEALKKAGAVLSSMAETLYVIPGGVGSGRYPLCATLPS